MPVAVQYNPSTLKVKYTVGTSKVQIATWNDCLCCFEAGQTPRVITLTFSGISLCSGSSWPGGVSLNRSWQLVQNDNWYCYYEYQDDNWYIDCHLDDHTDCGDYLIVGAVEAPGMLCAYFQTPLNEIVGCTTNANNDFIEDYCNGVTICGYGGSVIISW